MRATYTARRVRAVRRAAIVLALSAGWSDAIADPILECAGGSQVEIGRCLAGVEEVADGALQVALDIARRSAEELDQVTGRQMALPALEKSQAAWASYRDAQCEYIGWTFGGGSGTGAGIRACRINLTRDRVDQLLRAI